MRALTGAICLLVGGCHGEVAQSPTAPRDASPHHKPLSDGSAGEGEVGAPSDASAPPTVIDSTAEASDSAPSEVVYVPPGSLCNVKLTGCSAIVAIEQSAVQGFARLRCPTAKSTPLKFYPSGMVCDLVGGDTVVCYSDRLPPPELTTWKQLEPWYAAEVKALEKMWSSCATWGGSGYWTPSMPADGGAQCRLQAPMSAFDLPSPPFSDPVRLRVICRAAQPPKAKKAP